jgi:hypothetical protein
MKDFTRPIGQEEIDFKYWFLFIKNLIKNWLLKTFSKNITRLVINTNDPNCFKGDLASFTNLKYLNITGSCTVTGNIENLPPSLEEINYKCSFYPSYKL